MDDNKVIYNYSVREVIFTLSRGIVVTALFNGVNEGIDMYPKQCQMDHTQVWH